VSLRTVEIRPFSEAETRLLLTEPLRHSELFRRAETKPPHFDLAFWGEGGIDRIHAEAAGWPHLVQLLAEGVVQLVNLRGLSAATPALLEEAIATAAVRGDAVLRQLVRNECRLAGERDYLARFRTHDLQCRAGAPTVRLPAHRRCMVQRRCERCSADDRSRPARHGGRGRRGRACPVSAAFRNFTQEARFNRRHAEGG
jgi:hypothetical protein